MERRTGFFRFRSQPTLISVSSSLVKGRNWLKSPLWLDEPEHGGERDTSIALAVCPDRVALDYQGLPKIQKETSFWRRIWMRTRMRQAAYWGDPARATSEAGRRYLLGTVEEVFPKMRAVWEGANPQFIFKSWYSIVPLNKSFFKAWVIVILICFLAFFWLSSGLLKFEY